MKRPGGPGRLLSSTTRPESAGSRGRGLQPRPVRRGADGPNPAGGVVNWNENRCHAELQKGFGRSVEGDWLRFFRDYLTDDALGTPPTPQQFASQVRSVDAQLLDEFYVYTRFKSIVNSDARFTAIADVHGVNYPQ